MDVSKKIRGSSLIEAIAAMAIISIVLATGFTLYAKVVQAQQAVLKVRAGVEAINSFALSTSESTSFQNSEEYYTVNVTSEQSDHDSHLETQRIIVNDKAGNRIRETRRIIPAKQ